MIDEIKPLEPQVITPNEAPLQAKLAAMTSELQLLQAALRRRDEEIERLSGWLAKIEGGDHPCDDAKQLQRWAEQAVTLGRPVP